MIRTSPPHLTGDSPAADPNAEFKLTVLSFARTQVRWEATNPNSSVLPLPRFAVVPKDDGAMTQFRQGVRQHVESETKWSDEARRTFHLV